MLSFASGAPAWWGERVAPGHAVELLIYGERMTGRLRDIVGDTLSITVPVTEQVGGLLLSTAHGTAVISLEDGAARVPVSCWVSGTLIRLQVIGPIEFIQRRVHPRVTIRLPITLGWLRPGGRAWDHVSSFTVDLSAGGLSVAPVTTVWPSIGSPVQLRLDLPDGPWQTTAEAVGKTPDYGLRLRFTDLSAASAARISALLR